jgi:CheY-like chemotaxis protein
VVEDDASVRHVVTETLLDEGYDVLAAPDGAVALTQLQEYPPDVILLDYQMPVMDGPAFVHTYHQLPAPHAPIILMTAAVSAQQRAAHLGTEAVLSKPFDLEELVQLVGQFAA